MKRKLLRVMAALAYPLVLLISYEELREAFVFSNTGALERGEVPEENLFQWYLNDFTCED